MEDIKFPKAYDQYGADMGRDSVLPSDRNISIKLRLFKLQLDSGGYDEGGAYWGIPNNLYWVESVDEVETQYGGQPEVIQMNFRGYDREDVKEKVRKILPNAKFFR
jgi:hypothetical protein